MSRDGVAEAIKRIQELSAKTVDMGQDVFAKAVDRIDMGAHFDVFDVSAERLTPSHERCIRCVCAPRSILSTASAKTSCPMSNQLSGHLLDPLDRRSNSLSGHLDGVLLN